MKILKYFQSYFCFTLLLLASCSNEVSFSPRQYHELLDPVEGGSSIDEGTGREEPLPLPIPHPPLTTTWKVEVFKQKGTPQVDVLIIDDNSGSMLEEQTKMGSRFSSFIRDLNDVDWQIGITTTDVSDGPYALDGRLLEFGSTGRNILTPDMQDPEELFLNTMVRQETISCTSVDCPSSDERPLEASIRAMERRNGSNQGFFRKDVDIAIVILTDEDEGSDGNGVTGQDVVDHVASIWGTSKTVRGYGVIVEPGNVNCWTEQGEGVYSSYINTFVEITGGITGSICDTDYSRSLARISEDVKDFIMSYTLEENPIEGSVTVELDPAASIQWELDGRNLVFKEAPAPNTEVTIKYEVQVDPHQSKKNDQKNDQKNDEEGSMSENKADDN